MDEKEAKRKRIVVEEVSAPPEEPKNEPQIEAAPVPQPEAPEHQPEAAPEPLFQPGYSNFGPNEPEKSLHFLWVLIPGLFILGALAGGVFVYVNGITPGKSPSASPFDLSASPEAATEIVTPTPSPIPVKVDLTKYTVDIQNGSGIAGEATKAKTLLTTAGFKVGTAGNAKTFGYDKTEIMAKKDVDPSFLDQLKKTLEQNYLVDTPTEAPASQTAVVLVIVGKTKSQ